MSATDNPLKILITDAKEAFASWLLGRPVTSVRPLNVEFPARGVRSDLIFIVDDPPKTILHLELQGASSYMPMPLRELEYLHRITQREIGVPKEKAIRLHSVVMYVGKNAGKTDTGKYEVIGLNNTVTLSWQYTVIRLWEQTPDWLHTLGHPAFLALAGQTRLTKPADELPATLVKIREIEDEQLRTQVTGAFVSLLPNQEIITMMEAYLESDEQWVLDLPYLKMIREKAMKGGFADGLVQGREEGRAAAQAEARASAQAEARAEAEARIQAEKLNTVRNLILDGAVERFDPSARIFQRLLKAVNGVEEVKILESILLKLVVADTMQSLVASVDEMLTPSDS